MIAIVLVTSEALRSIFEHPRFGATSSPTRLAPAIVSHILGSRLCLDAPYLSGIISGPLDADKLDYMARDSYHAGLPVALDTNRLINKLEVVAITPENVTNPTLRDRAAATPGRRYYDIGISVAGLGAYEQMIVGRVILYDRLYYHHKVRAAEAMVRKLIEVAEHERGRQFVLEELFFNLEDDGMIDLFAGRLRADGFEGGNERARSLGATVRERQLYHRAYAVAKRFISGFEGLDAERQEQNRIYRWNILLEDLSSAEACRELERTIFETARRIGGELPGEFAPEGEELREEHIVLDIPFNKSVVRGSDILTRTEDGHLSTPNLFFDPERWSNAY
jgi:HD superfamily phosphohydrolase